MLPMSPDRTRRPPNPRLQRTALHAAAEPLKRSAGLFVTTQLREHAEEMRRNMQ